MLLIDSWAHTALGDRQLAVDPAMRAGPESSLGAAVALAHALLAAGDRQAAARALAAAPPGNDAPAGVRMAAWLADARLNYSTGDAARGRRSLEHALRLGEPELCRLPFAMERDWLRPVLRRDPELAQAYRRLLEPDLVRPGWMELRESRGQDAPVIVEPLSEREREVLEHVSAMESTAEIATEMYISVNTVKTHLKSIYRKLAGLTAARPSAGPSGLACSDWMAPAPYGRRRGAGRLRPWCRLTGCPVRPAGAAPRGQAPSG